MDEYTKTKLEEVRKGELWYMIGLPRSGKSTFSSQWELEKPKRVVVNADSIRLALHGNGFLLEKEPEVHHIVYITVKALLLQGYEVLVDETNYKPELRQIWRELGGKGIYIPTPIDICLSRVKGSDERVQAFKSAMIKMDEDLKKDPPQRGYDYEKKVVFNAT